MAAPHTLTRPWILDAHALSRLPVLAADRHHQRVHAPLLLAHHELAEDRGHPPVTGRVADPLLACRVVGGVHHELLGLRVVGGGGGDGRGSGR